MAIEFSGVCRELTISPDGVTLQIVLKGGSPEDRRKAFDLLGQPGTGVKVKCEHVEHGRYGQYARALYKSGVLTAPALLRKLGGGAEFVAWVNRQACCITNKPVAGYSRIIPPGAWPADMAGFFAVPLSPDLYNLLRHHGELDCIKRMSGGRFTQDEQARAWFQREALNTIRRWAWDQLRDAMDVGSMTQASPDMVRRWFAEHGLEQYLPRVYH